MMPIELPEGSFALSCYSRYNRRHLIRYIDMDSLLTTDCPRNTQIDNLK